MNTLKTTKPDSSKSDFWEQNLERLTYFQGIQEDRRPGDPAVVFSQSAYRSVMEHLSSDKRRELGGLLLGSYDFFCNTVHVEKALPATHFHSTGVSLTFEKDSWAEFDRLEMQF